MRYANPPWKAGNSIYCKCFNKTYEWQNLAIKPKKFQRCSQWRGFCEAVWIRWTLKLTDIENVAKENRINLRIGKKTWITVKQRKICLIFRRVYIFFIIKMFSYVSYSSPTRYTDFIFLIYGIYTFLFGNKQYLTCDGI